MKQYLNIDILRFIASFFIVAIHVSPFEKINPEFDFFLTRIFSRMAVPLFLMITGYYILDKSQNNINILKNYTKKILKIYFFCIIIYIPVNIYMGDFTNINLIKIIKDIFINGTLYHLWYFPALIIGIWIVYFLIKKLNHGQALIIIVILYLIGILGDSYYGITIINLILKNIYNFILNIFDYTRNGVFYVPIFLYMGYFTKINKINIKNSSVYCLILFICMSLEGFILHHFYLQRHDSMYVFLIPLMFFLFSYLINITKSSNKKIRDIATGIYIFHPMFILLIRFISGIIGMEEIFVQNNLIFYLLVCILTFIFSLLHRKIVEVIKWKKLS